MVILVGFFIVTVSVIGGYLMAHGNLYILLQPAEFVIIFGAAFGGFIVATPVHTMKSVKKGLIQVFKGDNYSKKKYMDLLLLLYELLEVITREGLREIEGHMDNVGKSTVFRKHPLAFRNKVGLTFIIDILRTLVTTTLSAHEMDSLLDNEIESIHEESLTSSRTVSDVADSLPGLGIVAAVLGVVITMGKMNEPPDVLGHSIGAAMVGTFLGILMAYGFVGPVGKKLEHLASEQRNYLDAIKIAFVSFTGGSHFKMAVEFSRRAIPPNVRPTYNELENAIRRRPKKPKKAEVTTEGDDKKG